MFQLIQYSFPGFPEFGKEKQKYIQKIFIRTDIQDILDILDIQEHPAVSH